MSATTDNLHISAPLLIKESYQNGSSVHFDAVDENSGTAVVDGISSTNVRHMNIVSLFLEFLLLGSQAFGGPMAQIAMLKQRFVIDEKWMSAEYFNRVQGVYQLIPGPEATELCIYFGILSAGRLGGLVAGIGFVLPGAILMLLVSILYVHVGINNGYFMASFRGIEPCVAAMMTVAVYRIGQHALVTAEARAVSVELVILAIASAILSLLKINIVLVLFSLSLVYFLRRTERFLILAVLVLVSGAIIALLFAFVGMPSASSSAIGIAVKPTPQSLFGLGFLGGLFSIGGAYSSVPFMQVEAEIGGWITQSQFIDALALSAVIPAPMVIFASFVGFIGGIQMHIGVDDLGGEIIGSTLCATGMFLPAFAITIGCHKWLDALVHNKSISALWCGMTAGVVGIVAVTAAHFTQTAINGEPLCAVLFVSVAVTLLSVSHPYLMLLCVTCCAIIGQIWFAPN